MIISTKPFKNEIQFFISVTTRNMKEYQQTKQEEVRGSRGLREVEGGRDLEEVAGVLRSGAQGGSRGLREVGGGLG